MNNEYFRILYEYAEMVLVGYECIRFIFNVSLGMNV